MKTTIKYSVLFHDGKKGKIKVDYKCPDFVDEAVPPLILLKCKLMNGLVNLTRLT